jgi:hypothetical protein
LVELDDQNGGATDEKVLARFIPGKNILNNIKDSGNVHMQRPFYHAYYYSETSFAILFWNSSTMAGSAAFWLSIED